MLRSNDTVGQKLEFYIHIYFAVFPIHPISLTKVLAGINNILTKFQQHHNQELIPAMADFRKFLETKGSLVLPFQPL